MFVNYFICWLNTYQSKILEFFVSIEEDVVRGVEVAFSVVDLYVVVVVVFVDVEVLVVSDRVVVGFDVVLIMVLVVLENDAEVVVLVVEFVSPL